MNLFWRTLLHFFFAPRTPVLGPLDVASSNFRVLLTDLDIYGHMNNGRYPSIADVARFDMLRRRGVSKQLSKNGWYPVVASTTVSYRKSLQLWQKFQIETRLLGYRDRDVFIEQRFVVKGEVFARQFSRARFLSKSGGHAPVDEVVKLWGIEPGSFELPEWLIRWASDAALPPARTPAPSEWD